jgi:hypothetical protein
VRFLRCHDPAAFDHMNLVPRRDECRQHVPVERDDATSCRGQVLRREDENANGR